MRRASAELAERRRASFGSRGVYLPTGLISQLADTLDYSLFTVGLRADGTLDPYHAAILFRDSRGVSNQMNIRWIFIALKDSGH